MENIIYRKVNGEVFEIKRDIDSNRLPYLIKEDNCFTDIMNFEYILSKRDIDNIRKTVHYIINNISNSYNGKEVIKDIFNILKESLNIDDLENILVLLVDSYEKMVIPGNTHKTPYELKTDIKVRDNFLKYLNENKELVLSIAIKRIISKYYLNLLLSLSDEKIIELEELKNTGVTTHDLLNSLGESFDKSYQKNGVYNLSTKIFEKKIEVMFDKLKEHLCWECKNATCVDCKKVADNKKKNIGQYDFIVDGHQIYNNGKLESFVVHKCDNYEKENRRRVTLDISENLSEEIIENEKKLQYKAQIKYAKKFIR